MKGLIAWFAGNKVAANLLMVSILFSGIYAMNLVPIESSPQYERKRLFVKASYPGATPEDMEQAVTSRVEQAIYDLEGIVELTSTASPGSASVTMKVGESFDYREVLDDVKARVEMIRNFPDDMEVPEVGIMSRRFEVISVVLSADLPERELMELGQRVRDEIVQLPEVTLADLTGVRPYEISIDISEQALREFGLGFGDVASAIRRASLDLPAGLIKAEGRELAVRTSQQAYSGEEFADIVIKTNADGTLLKVKDVASVRDDFTETPVLSRYNGKKAVTVEVFRIGDQDAIAIARAVRDYIDQTAGKLPAGVEIEYWRDRSKYIDKRINSLAENAIQGAILVFILLTLFLRGQLAFWVLVGMPVAIVGAFAAMPMLGITINYTSIFAFILVLGIVVDDAIVTGENIYRHLEKGDDPLLAAINGTKEVGVAVTFGVLTTVLAFGALLFMEGERSKMFTMIPSIVIPVLILSLVETKLILPAHLNHPLKQRNGSFLDRLQRKVSLTLEHFVVNYYQPFLGKSLQKPWLTISLFCAMLILIASAISSGWIRFTFFPRVQSEVAYASLTMPSGTSFEVTRDYIEKIESAAFKLKEQYRQENPEEEIIKGIHVSAGMQASSRMGAAANMGRVVFEILPPEERQNDITSMQIANEWRRMIGNLPGIQKLTVSAFIHGGGSPVDIALNGDSFETLTFLSEQIRQKLAGYEGVHDISDDFESGNEQVRLNLKPEAQTLGIEMADLAHQVRWGFQGQEVQRFQRGRDEVKVYVRYPLEERSSLESLKAMQIEYGEGISVPLEDIAELDYQQGPAVIRHVDRKRTLRVTADVEQGKVRLPQLRQELVEYLNQLLSDYPGVGYTLEGEAKEQAEAFDSLFWGFLLVLFGMYALLAIPLQSYLQPMMVMVAIPFGLLGAVLGHFLLGMNLTIQSVLGMLALTGVVVNDSLVLVDCINRLRQSGLALLEAILGAGKLRFRAILLTSLTTFIGLIPLMMSDNTQAQFLIPMAVSLAFGVLFATFITLILVPVLYMLAEKSKARAFQQEKLESTL